MSSPKYNKAKGAKFETDVMKWFRKLGVKAERLRLAGKDDEGDLVCIVSGRSYILELKNVGKLNLTQFWSEAQVEALNYAKARGVGEAPLHYVVVKRRNSGIEKSWVIQDLTQWLKEKSMPTPEGAINTSQFWSGETPAEPEEVELAEAVIAIEDDERLVEVIEEVVKE